MAETTPAEWVETGGGGGGGSGGSPSIIYGEATGIAQADIPVFSWSFDQRMQFADGTSPITYTVTGSIAGRRVTMTSYTIKALVPEWTVTPDPLSSTNIRTGKITSINSAKSKMGVYYGERELARSTNEIAFAKVDLKIYAGTNMSGFENISSSNNTLIVGVECSPKVDPGVMRVCGAEAPLTSNETKET